MQGCVQVYTGNGKGKTTAAIGLAVRAAGAGLRVFIAQFVKGMHYSELDALKRFEGLIDVHQYGRKCFIRDEPEREDVEMARQGLDEAKKAVQSGRYDIVILDEANIATYYQLFSPDELLNVVKNRPEQVEIIITGRYADKALLEIADLVTEMKEIKHYYQKGIMARQGIEN